MSHNPMHPKHLAEVNRSFGTPRESEKTKTGPVVKWIGNGIWIFMVITFLFYLNIAIIKGVYPDVVTLLTVKGPSDEMHALAVSCYMAVGVCFNIHYWRKVVRAIRRNWAIKWR